MSLIVILIPFQGILQNLSPNPSFEEYVQCPLSAEIDDCISWITPIGGTPDYYSICAGFVPYDYQYPHSGESHIGIWAYKLLHFGMPDPNLREYIQSELLIPLETNRCYNVSMYINNHNRSICGINNFGISLTQNSPSLVSQETYLLNASPQVYSKKIIADTLNWIKISGIVQAQGGEQYVTIGNFFQDSLTEHIEFLNLPNEPAIGAYYLIDDVTVIPIDSIPGGMPAYGGADTTIFIGDSLFLGQDVSNLNCTWYELGNPTPLLNSSPYESSLYVSPNDTTAYVVEQNLCGMITYDTVRVNTILKAPVVSANAPLDFCSGDSVTLTSDVTNGIVWSPTGETTPSITVSASGTYFVTHTFNGYTAVSQSVTTSLTTTPSPTLSSFPEMCDTNATFTFTEGSPTGGVYTVNGVASIDFDPNATLIGDNLIEYSLANGNCVGTASTVLTVVGCTVGLEESSPFIPLQRGKVFPNPNSGTFEILNNIGKELKIELFNALGQKMLEKMIVTETQQMETNLTKGLYFAIFSSEDVSWSEKMVVK